MIVNASVPRDRLSAAIDSGRATHLRPIMIAIRDAGIAFCVVPQGGDAFAPPRHKPTVVLIGDDMHVSQGPAGFDQQSLTSFVKRCSGAVIVSCEPILVVPGYELPS